MNIIIRYLICLLLLPLALSAKPHKQKYQYNVSICTIFKNEEKYLKEWIDYHSLVGVDHFYLYNNGSTDNYMSVLKSYVDKGVVEVIDFPNVDMHLGWNYGTQPACYRNGLDRARGVSKWLCIIDTDEFLVPMTYNTLTRELDHYPKQCVAIYPKWITFGTSYITVHPGEWMITRLFKRAPLDHPNNHHGKSIVQPEFVETCLDPHVVKLKAPHGYYNGNGDPEMGGGVNASRLRIHHYTYRDEAFMRGEKAERVRKWGYDPQVIFDHNDEYCVEEDYSIMNVLFKANKH